MEYKMLTEVRSEESKRIRRETRDRDYSPRRGKILVPRKDNLVNALQTSLTKDHYVLVTPKSTSTQLKYTKGTMTTGTTEMQQQSTLVNSPTSISLLEDSLAKLSVWLENEQDLTTLEAHSFLTSQGFLKKKDHDIWYSKTSKVYLLTKREQLSRQSLGFLPTWGIELNGKYLTAKTSEFPKTEKGSLLSDILEENVDQKYFLSETTVEKILPKISYTIDANYHKGTNVEQYKKKKRRQIVTQGVRVRRLTPKECERLQGFPDNWTE